MGELKGETKSATTAAQDQALETKHNEIKILQTEYADSKTIR